MATQIKVRRGTAAAWTSADPTLAEGEIGFETDTAKFKIGDGSTAWTGITTYYNLLTLVTLGAMIGSATSKATPIDADYIGLMDSAASDVLKKLSWANIKATLKTYFDSLTTTFTNKTIALGSNTVSGTMAEFDTALSDGNFATQARAETLTNKTLTSPVINTPTGIVKGDVGLGNVDNTSDATKNAATVTLTNKTLTSPVINSPTGIVKGDVGLGSVDNTADADKPISDDTQAALDLKQNIIYTPVDKVEADSPVTVGLADSGTWYGNAGAGGTVTFNLPASAGCTAGKEHYYFSVLVGQRIVIAPNGADTIRGTESDAVANISSISMNNYVEVRYRGGGMWAAMAAIGIWTEF